METTPTTPRHQRLIETRKRLGWSQGDVARKCKMTQQAVSNAENALPQVQEVFWTVLMDFCDKVDDQRIRAEDKPAKEGTAA